jgi:hypothetical protein
MNVRNIALPISIQETDLFVGISVKIGSAVIQQWCLELSLLARNLSNALRIRSTDGSVRIQIQIDNTITNGQRASITWSSSPWSLALSPLELEVWEKFFLECYRDGFAPVSSIDLDIGKGRKTDGKGLYLTLHAPAWDAPVSESEARRRLGLKDLQ